MGKPKSVQKRRRPRGEGSVFPDRRRGGWVAKIPRGRGSNGKLLYDRPHFDAHEDAVRAWRSALPPAPTITLADWSPRWLAALDVRPRSRDCYEENLRYRVLPALGALAVAAITPFHVEEAARKWGAAVGVSTVRFTLATLSACLQAAVRAELIARNPARAVRRPRPVDPPLDLFTAAELRRIIDACLPDRRLHPFAVCAATGCRIGEALARDPADYDPATARWSVCRTVVRGHAPGPPKSRHGLRTIEAPPLVRPLFALPVESASYDTAQGRWERLLAALELRHRGTHQMRHTVASLLLARGLPLADVARYIGDSVAVLVRTYTHATGQDVSGAIADLLGGAEVAPKAEKSGKSRRKAAAPNLTR